jgi:hypothetical protein
MLNQRAVSRVGEHAPRQIRRSFSVYCRLLIVAISMCPALWNGATGKPLERHSQNGSSLTGSRSSSTAIVNSSQFGSNRSALSAADSASIQSGGCFAQCEQSYSMCLGAAGSDPLAQAACEDAYDRCFDACVMQR